MEGGSAGKHVGLFGLVVMGFFWVNGGIYGNEELLGAGPPAVVLACTLLLPLLFSLPVALITAELAIAFPADGGQAVWVEQALGGTIGAHNSYWLWVTNIVDAAVYPQMILSYLHIPGLSRREHPVANHISCFAIVAGLSLVSLRGIDWMSRVQGVLLAVTLTPCLIFIGWGLTDLRPNTWVETEGEVDGALLLSWALWLYSGFSWLGCLAGEVEKPQTTYVAAMCILLPLVTALNMLPFLVSLSMDPDVSHYEAGYFKVLAGGMAGWLAQVFSLGGVASLLGLLHSQMIAADATLAAFAKERYDSVMVTLQAEAAKKAASPQTGAEAGTRAAPFGSGWLVRFREAPFGRFMFDDPPDGGAPHGAVLFNSICISFLLTLHYQILVEVEMMLLSISQILLFVAFVVLRVKEPNAPRPLRIPGGLPVACLLLLSPTAICAATVFVNVQVPFRACCLCAVALVGLAAQLVASRLGAALPWRPAYPFAAWAIGAGVAEPLLPSGGAEAMGAASAERR